MEINAYIKDLLYQEECVTVPKFGAFLTRFSASEINENSAFKAPEKQLIFNNQLTANDGVLANYIAEKCNISYENALRNIEKRVRVWKKKLKTQPLEFPGIGKILMGESKTWEFVPFEENDFNTNAYGFGDFNRSPVRDLENSENNSNNNISIMEDTFNNNFDGGFNDNPSQNEPLMFTPENDSDGGSNLGRNVIIAILIIAVGGAAYYFGDLYIQDQKAKEASIAQEKIKEKVQNTTFDLGSFSKVVVDMDALEGENVFASSSNRPALDGEIPYYSVIAATFTSLKNAEEKISQLRSEGYNASFVNTNPQGMHRVAYGRFNNKQEAINLLYFIRFGLKEEAWFLEESVLPNLLDK